MSDKRRVNPEMLVGVSAVVIGVCALGVSLYETNLMREEQRAAVIPLVELSRSYYVDHDRAEGERVRLDLNIANVGIGPARISDFQVRVDDRICICAHSAGTHRMITSRALPPRHRQQFIV